MMKSFAFILMSLVLAAVVHSAAGDSGAAEAAHVLKLDQLSWLAGKWEGEEDGVFMEEVWLDARGGLMLGLHRDSRPGAAAFFEYLRIEERTDGLVYLASPRGQPATEFTAVELSDSLAVFQNPAHDYPQKISYRVDDTGRLHVQIAGMDASAPVSEWVWERRGGSGAD